MKNFKKSEVEISLIQKSKKIIRESVPVLIMVLFIPFIKNEYFLSLIFIIIISISFFIKYRKNEYLIFIFGFILMIVFETIFVKSGVETFNKNTLFGIMPLWLPLLWAYSFVAIKRGVKLLSF